MSASSREQSSRRCVFYFDLGSPYAYLAAERISGVFTDAELEQPEWQPILLGGLFKRFGRDSWANGPGREDGIAEVERRAAGYGLPALVWPEPWPGNTLFAMRAATFAKQTGRAVSFALAGFRQAFAAGRDLSEHDNVLIAAAACELHPNAVGRACGAETVKRALIEATEAAAGRGVIGVPSIAVGEQVFWGDDRLEEAVEAAG
jgi:2-hydroxychromene-2-carboxylate isomerase